jgi:hypothetical protein
MDKIFLNKKTLFFFTAFFFWTVAFSSVFAQVNASVGGTCSYIQDPIVIGGQNDMREVVFLQSFLQLYEQLPVAITGEFDGQTILAVREFQKRYAKDILEPWGLTTPTGVVSVTTIHKINEIYCGTDSKGLSSEEEAVIAAVLKKSPGTGAATPTATSLSNMVKDQNDRLGGTPVGFIDQFSLPILIVLFALLFVQVLFLWGFFPRLKRVPLIPHSFE